MATLLPAAIYLRFSKAQANEMKIEDQFTMCVALAEQHGYSVAEDTIYVDHGVSAKDGKNRLAALGRLMVDIEAGRFSAVIMQNQDRLSREDELTSNLAKLCARKAVKFLTNEGEADPATAIGRFTIGLRGLLAQMEIMRKGERQDDSNIEKRRRGEPVRAGLRAFGYVCDRTVVGTKVIITEHLHPQESELIADAYEYVLALPEDVVGSGLSTIATYWNELGMTTVRGNRWTLPSVEKVLRRAYNCGLVEHRTAHAETGKLSVWAELVRDEGGEPVRGTTWPTIVTEDVYFGVIARLNDPRRTHNKPRQATHLLSSIALCVCGQKLRTAGRERKLDESGNPKSVVVYRCSVHQGLGHKSSIKHVNIVTAEADEVVAGEVVRAMMLTPTSLAPDPAAAQLRTIHERLGKIRRDIEATHERMTDADLAASVPAFKAKLRDLRREEEELEAGRAAVAQSSARAALVDDLRHRVAVRAGVVDLDAAVAEFRQVLTAFLALPLEDRRALVRAYVEVKVQHGRRRRDETHLTAARRRIEIVHKVAVQLNPPAEGSDATSASSGD